MRNSLRRIWTWSYNRENDFMPETHMLKPLALALSCAVASPFANAHETIQSPKGPIIIETVASGLEHPWALGFLPDGRMLVTERPGRIRVVTRSGEVSPSVRGVPPVHVEKDSGLLDLALDREFPSNHTLYFCFAEAVGDGGRTTVARARFIDGEVQELADVRVIFRQEGPVSNGNHYGCRIAQSGDGTLFVTLGDNEHLAFQAQNLANHIGKVVRIRPDGTVPPDNPFVGRAGAKPEIWSYGHRNSQGAAIHPKTGTLWIHEHGPRGGDEVNIPLAGGNYGWPVIGYGSDYSGAEIHVSTHQEDMEQPIWVMRVAPSGMTFYNGDLFPDWNGSLFLGGLSSKRLVRLTLSGDRVVAEEHLLIGLGERLRDVRQGPDGALWLLTDSPNGRIFRLRGS